MKRLIRVGAERIRSSSPATLTTLGILYEVVLGLLDYATPEEMSFTIFYLLGVAFVGWAVGRHAALLVSAVAAGIMASHEWALPDFSRRGILFWNTSTRFL